MADKIQLRRDAAADWLSVNPILAAGEPGVELDTGNCKIGNGVDTWSNLPYLSGGGGGASALDDLTDVDLTTTPPQNGDGLVYDGSVWVPGTASTTGTNPITLEVGVDEADVINAKITGDSKTVVEFGDNLTEVGTITQSATGGPNNRSYIECDGSTSNYLVTSAASEMGNLGTGDFTIECWVYQTANQSNFRNGIFGQTGGGDAGRWNLRVANISNSNALSFAYDNGSGAYNDVNSALSITNGAWNHVAIARSGSNFIFAVNGTTQTIAIGDPGDPVGNAANEFYVFRNGWDNVSFNGRVSDIRILKGYAAFTGDFTIASTDQFIPVAGITSIAEIEATGTATDSILTLKQYESGVLTSYTLADLSYGSADVDTHLNQSTATTGQVLSWDGADYDWIDAGGGSTYNATLQSVTDNGSSTTNTITIPAVTKNGTNGAGDIGQSANRFNTVYATTFDGVATSAKYADLAEKYLPDADYEPGTVLVLGGDAEVTQSNSALSPTVAGVVSANPAHLMNADLENGVAIALRGRIPVKVTGKVKKGDILVTSNVPGHAQSAANLVREVNWAMAIGKALETKDTDGEGVIEVLV